MLSVLNKVFREQSQNDLIESATHSGVKIDFEGALVADTSAASLIVAPVIQEGSKSSKINLVHGHFRGKKIRFRQGFYTISIFHEKGEFSNEATWISHSKGSKRKSKIWFVPQGATSEKDRVSITSVEERELNDGTCSVFVDGTVELFGHEYHFFLYF